MLMELGWVWSSGLRLQLVMLTLMVCFSLLCGFGSLCVIRRAAGARPRVVSLASCVSAGVFLSSCLLELLPDYQNHSRDTFSRLGLALHFPLAEFLLAMGFLLVLVLEQMLLALREPADEVSVEKQALIEEAGRPLQRSRGPAGLRVFLLELSVCVCALLQGLSVQWDLQECVPLLLHEGLMAFALSARLSHCGLRPALVSAGLLLFSLARPAGIGIGFGFGMSVSAQVQLMRCALEGLTAGIFIHVSIGGLLWQDSASPKHRVHEVALLLTGFALGTAILFTKV